MSILLLILIFKITLTIFAIVLPFFLRAPQKLAEENGLTGESSVLFRLYGISVIALLAIYSFGIYQLTVNIFPIEAIWVGVISNIGASVVLIQEKYLSKTKARIASTKSILTFGFIGLGLIITLIYPITMTNNLF